MFGFNLRFEFEFEMEIQNIKEKEIDIKIMGPPILLGSICIFKKKYIQMPRVHDSHNQVNTTE